MRHYRISLALALAVLPTSAWAQDSRPVALGVVFQGGASEGGVRVNDAVPGATGAEMGLQAGDVIKEAGGTAISSSDALIAYIKTLKVGDPVALTVSRGGQDVKLSGKALPRPDSMPSMPPPRQ